MALTDRDPAGEMGTCEDDLIAELGNDFEPVWPDLGPDMHGYIEGARRVAIAAALILYGGALFGLGFFVGWAVWGQ